MTSVKATVTETATDNAVSNDILESGAKAFCKELMLEEGVTHIDMTIRIQASVKVGADYTQAIWQSAKPEQILKLLSAYSPLMRDVIANILAEGQESISSRLAALDSERDEQVDSFIGACRLGATRKCSGKTTFPSISVNVPQGHEGTMVLSAA